MDLLSCCQETTRWTLMEVNQLQLFKETVTSSFFITFRVQEAISDSESWRAGQEIK